MTWARKRKTPEHDFQAKVLKPFLDLALPIDAFWTSVDHSGGGVLLGARRKAKGAKSGLPDVWIFWRGRAYCMELKAQYGNVSDDQRTCIRGLDKAGVPTGLVKSLAEAELCLGYWQIPLRASLEPRAAAQARLT